MVVNSYIMVTPLKKKEGQELKEPPGISSPLVKLIFFPSRTNSATLFEFSEMSSH
jgi:hypothetical protein